MSSSWAKARLALGPSPTCRGSQPLNSHAALATLPTVSSWVLSGFCPKSGVSEAAALGTERQWAQREKASESG